MGIEIDLLKRYPKTKRDLSARLISKSEANRTIARRFDKEFFDGSRETGYGGFSYHPRFWADVVVDFIEYYRLSPASSLLDVGCAKGFMLRDFLMACPGIKVSGVDVSNYAVQNCHEEVIDFVECGCATNLPFAANSFDLAVSINTIHNLDLDGVKLALNELQRVSKNHCFVTVDAYRNDEEKERMFAWNLTAKTILSVEEWLELFKETGYEGDYYWFIP